MNRTIPAETDHEGAVIPPELTPSEAGRRRILSRRGEPLFIADWDRALFLHFEVDPGRLQSLVPFELDLFDNRRAFVSLVAFTMRGMRPRFGGKIGAWVMKPIATHPFLNLRTYIRCDGEPGIHFLAEWLPNRLACLLGPPIFGLPYRFGKIDYRHHREIGRLGGKLTGRNGENLLEYEADLGAPVSFEPCRDESRDAFLLERYTAFTGRMDGKRRGFFRVWHDPWQQIPVEAEILKNRLPEPLPEARFAGANYSPGAHDVWMGRPHSIESLNRLN